MTEAEMQRAVAFMHVMEERSHTRRGSWRWGTAFFHDGFPVKWDLNFLRVDGSPTAISAPLVADEAHRTQGGSGLKHRMIHVDDQAIGKKLAPGFTDLGWIVHHLVLMALREPPDASPGVEVVEKTYEELYAVRIEAEQSEYQNSEDDARALTESRKVTEASTNLRNLVGLIDGQVAGWAELYSDGRTAQIEDIGTFKRFRNRGVARSMILKAIDLARSEGHDFIFMIADCDDWPKELYKKLGFEAIGEIYEFLLRPDQPA